jgi:hypothetical protein
LSISENDSYAEDERTVVQVPDALGPLVLEPSSADPRTVILVVYLPCERVVEGLQRVLGHCLKVETETFRRVRRETRGVHECSIANDEDGVCTFRMGITTL